MASDLRFRNIDASPDDPVETWPFEGVLAALERGTLPDWRRLIHSIDADPWGVVAREVEEALLLELPYGVAPLFHEAIREARARAAESEEQAVAAEVRDLVTQSGLSLGELAARIGTSASRLSTYRSGKVVPSAALMVRMRNVVQRTKAENRPQ
ncbi:MAG: helix-turn-helix transcriptional regulator [Actinomycetota bacterium]|jgi:DNA-binding transcriptional regulator YiaG|nr:helix-turn-helix transcriptional regulator [Actinomycetota bacterium]